MTRLEAATTPLAARSIVPLSRCLRSLTPFTTTPAAKRSTDTATVIASAQPISSPSVGTAEDVPRKKRISFR
jgi:hypothetical protein